MLSRIACLFYLVLLCLLSFSCSRRGLTPSGPPPAAGILLLVVDTLRADQLGCYGFPQPTSPHLDAVAARGVRFDRYTTVTSSTLASFTSLLTSRHPHTHGVFRNGVVWPRDLEGLPSVLRSAGYETAAFIASYCLSSDFGMARGFDHFDEDLTVRMKQLPSNRLIRKGSEVAQAFISWLAGRRRPQAPFFAMLHFFEPHWPYQPSEFYRELFGPGYDGWVTGAMPDFRKVRRYLTRHGGEPDADVRHLHALHLGEIRSTDDQIGKVLEALEQRDLRDRVLLIVTADHGETFYEHQDFFNHGESVYDTNIHIPLIIDGPGIASPQVVETPFSNLDLAPTLLEYVGLEIPPTFEGRSFLPLLKGGGSAPGVLRERSLFAEATKPHTVEQGERWPNRLKSRCILRGRWKLIHSPWREDLWELYDLKADPQEQHNLLDGSAENLSPSHRQMARELILWSERVPGSVPDDPEADAEVRERLEALGYS